MSYMVTVTLDLAWVADGTSGATLGQNQSNEPGYTSSLTPGPVPGAQSLRLMISEMVAGGATLTQGNLNTAVTAAATDLNTRTATAGAWAGNAGTPTAIATAWATGAE